jgi:hypothetical protein
VIDEEGGSGSHHLLADRTNPLFEEPIAKAFGMVVVLALQRRHLLPIAYLVKAYTTSTFPPSYIYCCPP